MVPALSQLGVKHVSVFSSFEAKQAYPYLNREATIMIMGDIAQEDVAWVVDNEVDYFVYNPESITDFLNEAKKQEKTLQIHIELETGMHRHGYEEENWDDLIKLVKDNEDYISLKGLCTHFAGAESSANFKRIEQQQE